MAKRQMYGKTFTREGKDCTVYFGNTSCTGAEVPGDAVLKDNYTNTYYLTELLNEDEKTEMRDSNSVVNICKSVQKGLDALQQATERASRFSVSEAQSAKLNELVVQQVAALQNALKPRVKLPKGQKAKQSYAHLLAR